MRIVSNDEMRKIDEQAIHEVGIPSLVLMENAGLEAARFIGKTVFESGYSGEVLIFCGKGKNGGDGLVIARRLISSGHRVRVFLLHPASEYTHESATNLKILEALKAKVSVVESAQVVEEYFRHATPPFVVVDAMLGTGLRRDIEGLYYDVVEIINRNPCETIALDIPTGVSGDNGQICGAAINATMTISFGYPKLGHFLVPGAAIRGKLFNVDLTFPRTWRTQGDKFLLAHENTAALLQHRDRFGHKNSFGHCLLIGGSPGRIGAIEMASRACLKMGTGLVTVASWEDSFPSLETKLSSEIMNFRITKDADGFQVPKPGLSQFSAVVVGPGLGLRQDGADVLRILLSQYAGPLVIDADGLNLLSEHQLIDDLSRRRHPTVLTPHPGEMARLLSLPKEKVVKDPLGCVRKAVEATGAVVLLKGATTFIHAAEGKTWLNHYPNDGMATAGSGDVLAGMIGGLLGQRMSAEEATKLGVYLHSLAGRIAAESKGHRAMTASDIIENTGLAFKDLRSFEPLRTQPACVELT